MVHEQMILLVKGVPQNARPGKCGQMARSGRPAGLPQREARVERVDVSQKMTYPYLYITKIANLRYTQIWFASIRRSYPTALRAVVVPGTCLA